MAHSSLALLKVGAALSPALAGTAALEVCTVVSAWWDWMVRGGAAAVTTAAGSCVGAWAVSVEEEVSASLAAVEA